MKVNIVGLQIAVFSTRVQILKKFINGQFPETEMLKKVKYERSILTPPPTSPVDSLQPTLMFTTCPPPFILSLHLFVSCSPPPSPHTSLWMPSSYPLAGATPPIGRLSRCVHPLSLTTTSQARRASWHTPSRALYALHPLIRGTAHTGTPPPSQHASLHCSPLLLLLFLNILTFVRINQLFKAKPTEST